MDICFVILNYNVVRETINCVRSIEKNIDTPDYKIIIIDNNSSNNAGKIIRRKLRYDGRVSVHIMKENVGFARGNNQGIKMARKLNPSFICCMNNDILFDQRCFWRNLNRIYSKLEGKNIGLIAPVIYDRVYRIHDYEFVVEPKEYYESEIDAMQKEVDSYNETGAFLTEKDKRPIEAENNLKRMLLENNVVYDINRFRRNCMQFVMKYRDMYRYHRMCRRNGYPDRKSEMDKILHGCCLVFTPRFFECLDGFNNDTFMFNEEEVMYLEMKEKGLRTLYCSRLIIRHLEDVSTDSVYGVPDEKRKFTYENQIKSYKVIIDHLR